MAPHRRRVLFASLTTLTLALATTGPALADDDAPPAHPLAALIAGGAEVTATGEIAEVIADPSGETTWYLRAGAADVELDPMSLPAGSATGDEISATVEVPGEAIAALSLSEAAALAATSRVNAAANDPVDEATDTGAALLSAAESAGVPAQLTATTVLEAAAEVVAAPPAPSPHYLHIAFMSRTDRGKFYTSEQLDTFVRGLSSYWVRESHGVISDFVYSWDDTVAIQSDLGCTGSLFQITTAATNALGLTTAAASGAGHHVVVLSPNDDTAGCANAGTYSGVALLGSRGLQSGGYVHVFANAAWPGESSHVISHEVGHNLSLHHAGTGTCPSGTVDGPFTASGPCTIQSTNDFYGDLRNVMGWGNPGTTTLNSFQKRQLSLIDDGAGLVLVSGNQDTGYTIAPSATTSLTAAQGLKVSDTSGGINR
ncbi:MAG: hypothetical protein LBK72_09845, partial [Bifidobacteriaceae bacterium]|nr:hypothetical protein [Bifidobacteriaceae bacterium]